MLARRVWAVMLGFGVFLAVLTSPTAPASAVPGAGTGPGSSPVSTRVVGGSVADRNATTWFMQFNPQMNGDVSLCAASALNSHWAVTAAHCVASKEGRKVAHAATGKGKSFVLANPWARNFGSKQWIDRIVVNPGYTFAPYHWNDVALIHSTVDLRANPIATNTDPAQPALGAAEQVFGFGTTIDGNYGSVSSQLRVGSVSDLSGPSGSCGSYGATFNPKAQLCAGVAAGGVDACQGDSGGPLVSDINGVPTLVGIVSSGQGCAEAGYPGLYTRVSTYAGWISSIVTPRSNVKISVPCPNHSCRMRSGGSLKMAITNKGDVIANVAISSTPRKLRASRRSVTLRPNQTKTVNFNTSGQIAGCVKATVTSPGANDVGYKFKINGGNCQ